MEKYQQYVNSGFEWIGDIPAQWHNLRLRFVCEFRNGYTPSKANPEFWEDGTIPWYRMEDIRDSGRKLEEAKQYVTKDAIKGGGLFEAGSFILATTATIGEHAVLIVDSLANQRFTNLKIRKSLSNRLLRDYFFYYLFVIDDYCKATTKTSTFPAVSMELLKNCHVVFPLVQEQQAIVDYLDKKCSEIDNVISAQQKRIALLQELKQSVITHAVTKGLNPNVEMKDSGVEWIGEVPKHWKIYKIKHCCKTEQYSIKTGPFGTQLKGEDLQPQGDVAVYSQQNVINNDFTKVRYFVSFKKAESLKGFYTMPNDILVTSRGTIGKAAILSSAFPNGILHPCLIALRLKQEICLNDWLVMYINETDCFKTDVTLSSNATTIDVIYTGTIKHIYIPIPPSNEQVEILAKLKEKCASIDSAISKAQHQVELLQEYKQSLITEVVTGKRKVS